MAEQSYEVGWFFRHGLISRIGQVEDDVFDTRDRRATERQHFWYVASGWVYLPICRKPSSLCRFLRRSFPSK